MIYAVMICKFAKVHIKSFLVARTRTTILLPAFTEISIKIWLLLLLWEKTNYSKFAQVPTLIHLLCELLSKINIEYTNTHKFY